MQRSPEIGSRIRNILTEAFSEVVYEGHLDLTNFESCKDWVWKNVDDIDDDYRDPMNGMSIDEIIRSYMNIYKKVMSKKDVTLYRALLLGGLDELDIENIGVFWAFELKGAGIYGAGASMPGDSVFTLTAIAETKDINWEQGFYSFTGYSSELECYMDKGCDIQITHIDDKKLETPIEAKT